MNDFIFGTLATEELRRERAESLRAGVTHNIRRYPRDPRPDQAIELLLTSGPAHPGDRAWVYWSTDGQEPSGRLGTADHGQVLEMTPAGVEWDTVLWGYVRSFRAVLPGQPVGTVLRYRLSVTSTTGDEVFADGGTVHAVYIADDPTPAWTADAVVYQIFVDRFHPGAGRNWLDPENPAGFYGGRIRGITENLPYLFDLGVNCLWLTPIFPSPSHHGYDTTDFFEIEPRLGNKVDLKDLLNEAHSGGMRVLLDFVPNHISNDHALFQSAAGEAASPYRDWFTFTDWPHQYETFFGVPSLPQVNLRNPAARQHVLDAAQAWLEFGVDGYRVDYAIGPAVEFWADFRQVTRSANPDCWTFGEIVDPPDTQVSFEGALDGSLDFILLEGLRQSFAFGNWDAARFGSFLDRHEAFFPRTFSRPSFLDNHDMNRFLWAAGQEQARLRLAALCQFTLPGQPVIYYGTEVGLSQERDVRQGTRGLPEESRLPMLWGSAQDQELKAYYRSLIHMRAGHPALTHGLRKTVLADRNVLVYQSDGMADALVTALNISSEPRQVSLDFPLAELLLVSDPDCRLDADRGLVLAPFSGAVLQPGPVH